MSWSRKKTTLCLSSSARISATSSGERDATPRLTFESSAPIVQVSGSTLIEPRFAMYAGASAVAFAISSLRRSIRLVADDSGTLEVPYGGPEILHRVVLRAAVVPDRHAVVPE